MNPCKPLDIFTFLLLPFFQPVRKKMISNPTSKGILSVMHSVLTNMAINLKTSVE